MFIQIFRAKTYVYVMFMPNFQAITRLHSNKNNFRNIAGNYLFYLFVISLSNSQVLILRVPRKLRSLHVWHNLIKLIFISGPLLEERKYFLSLK